MGSRGSEAVNVRGRRGIRTLIALVGVALIVTGLVQDAHAAAPSAESRQALAVRCGAIAVRAGTGRYIAIVVWRYSAKVTCRTALWAFRYAYAHPTYT
jgi:hypothetical protein